MNDNLLYERLLEKDHKPSEANILIKLRDTAKVAWNDLQQFLKTYYDFTPETVFYGSNYGWSVRYRRSGKTLCSLFPEEGAFTVLVILGRKEAETVILTLNEFSTSIQQIIMNTGQLHDGRWLWVRVLTITDINDVKKLIKIKKKPKKI